MGLESTAEVPMLDSTVSPGSGDRSEMLPGPLASSSDESDPDSTGLGFSANGKVKSTGANSPLGSGDSRFVDGAAPSGLGKGSTESTGASVWIPFGRGLSIKVSSVLGVEVSEETSGSGTLEDGASGDSIVGVGSVGSGEGTAGGDTIENVTSEACVPGRGSSGTLNVTTSGEDTSEGGTSGRASSVRGPFVGTSGGGVSGGGTSGEGTTERSTSAGA